MFEFTNFNNVNVVFLKTESNNYYSPYFSKFIL